MSGSSTIDISSLQTGTLAFNGSSYGSGLLTILNWDGNYGGGGNTHLAFTSSPGVNFLNNVKFDGFSQGAVFVNGYELAPIPEPATIIGALALVGLLCLRERRRFSVLFKKTTSSK